MGTGSRRNNSRESQGWWRRTIVGWKGAAVWLSLTRTGKRVPGEVSARRLYLWNIWCSECLRRESYNWAIMWSWIRDEYCKLSKQAELTTVLTQRMGGPGREGECPWIYEERGWGGACWGAIIHSGMLTAPKIFFKVKKKEYRNAILVWKQIQKRKKIPKWKSCCWGRGNGGHE